MLNGPNLNLLGEREPSVYGSESLADVQRALSEIYPRVEFRTSNSESEMIGWVHEIFRQGKEHTLGVIINPGAFTHYSYALRDALAVLKQADIRCVELHISNPSAREEFRHTSVISPVVTGVIAGLGIGGYALCARFLQSQSEGEGVSGTK